MRPEKNEKASERTSERGVGMGLRKLCLFAPCPCWLLCDNFPTQTKPNWSIWRWIGFLADSSDIFWWSRAHTHTPGEREGWRDGDKYTGMNRVIASLKIHLIPSIANAVISPSELMVLPLVIIIIIFYPNRAKVECQPSLHLTFSLCFFLRTHSCPLNRSKSTAMSTTMKIANGKVRHDFENFAAKQRMVSRPTVFLFAGVCVFTVCHLRNVVNTWEMRFKSI